MLSLINIYEIRLAQITINLTLHLGSYTKSPKKKSRTDKIPNGQNPKSDKISNGQNLKCTTLFAQNFEAV